MADDELVARILTAPDAYDLSTGELITERLTNIYRAGLSLVRAGATDDEILQTIHTLIGAVSSGALVGAVVVRAGDIRACNDGTRWFCVYHTEAPISRHADVAGTFDPSMSNNAWKKALSVRRRALKRIFAAQVISESDPQRLLGALRAKGI